MYRRLKPVKKKASDDRTRKKVKDSSKSFIRILSEGIGNTAWLDLGQSLGFTQPQMVQLKTSYTGDHCFCAQIMLREWHSIAKKFLEQPEAHVCAVLRQMGNDTLAESVCQQSKIDGLSHERDYDKDAMAREIQTITFGPTTTVAAPSVTQTSYHISNCDTVVIGASNSVTCSADHHTPSIETAKEESSEAKVIRSLKSIIERNPGQSKGTNLQKVEGEFHKLLRTQGNAALTFHSFTGKKLIQFLKDHTDKFEIKAHGSKCYVNNITTLPTITALVPKTTPPACIASSVDPCNKGCSDDEFESLFEDATEVSESKAVPTKTSNAKSYADVVMNRNKCVPINVSNSKPQQKLHSLLGQTSNDIGKVYTDPRDLLSFVNDFTRGHYVLLICCKERVKHLDCLAFIPWLAVFDFDEESRDVGLLSILEERIKKIQAIYPCTWKDPARFAEYCTEWCLIRGSVQEADSRTPQNCRQWFRTVRDKLDEHFEKLATFTDTYTTVKCIAVLPDDEETLRCMHKTISHLDEYIEPAPTIIICDPQALAAASSNWIYQAITVNFILRCSVQDFCKSLSMTSFAADLKRQPTLYGLPTADETNNPGFDESFVSVLREDLEVLYLDNPSNRKINLDTLKEEGDRFLKGGTLRWFAFYECDAGHYDAERDIMEAIVRRVKEKCLKPFRSGIIRLNHAPGSGGTTLMQRVLWDLRKSSPCAQVKIHPTMSVQDLAHNLESLFEKTHLPLVLLVDGGEDRLTKELLRLLTHVVVVILQVKRYPHPISTDERPGNKFFLKGQVSQQEATKLAMKFLGNCDNDDKKEALDDLVDDVRKGTSHSLYEFGLTTFLEDYRGIASYVRGYLQLESNLTKELNPWQEIIGFLSLAYYYGQTSMPCQFFASMLGKPLNYNVTFCDFPHYVQELIVACNSEGRKNNIRICHYIVAKGILDQILTWPQTYVESKVENGLSLPARSKLVHFAYRFIEESKKKSTRMCGKSNIVIDILTRTFLHRDYKDVGEGEAMQKRTLSTLLEDIHCYTPFNDRISVIEKLAMAFPENPNFCAHLGRIYTICKPDEDEIAGKCFKKALGLCKKQIKGKRTDDIDDGTKRTLMYVYHMYGIHYVRRITKYTGRLGESPKVRTIPGKYQERVKDIIQMADEACRYFTRLRDITPLGSEEGYGYIDEITVRLQVCCFISNFFPKDIPNFGVFVSKEGETHPGKFVIESITEIAELFMECYSAVDTGELGTNFYRNVNMYNVLFQNDVPILNYIPHSEDIETRSFKAAAIKLKYGQGDNLGVVENITSKDDIEEIVKMYEQTFEEIQQNGVTDKRRMLEHFYKDWILAIRHNRFPTNYSQDDVLLRVRYWSDILRSPMSKFYLFCMLSVIGIGTNDSGRVDHLLEASEIREDLLSLRVHFQRPRFPREWLGKGFGIKALIHSSTFCGNIEDRNVKGELNTSHLTILKGTICRPNKQRQTGYINLDLEEGFNTIRVFFIPVRTEEKLVGQTYAGQRVEFALAFTTANGYEAYNVTLLKKILCSDCNGYMEIKSDEKFTTCRRCNTRLYQE